MAECRKVVVAVTLLVLAARIASSVQAFRTSQVYPDVPNDVLFAPELKVPLSVALALRSSDQSLPRRVDVRCSPARKRCSLAVKVRVSPWLLFLVLCGDVEANPGPACERQHPNRRCDKVPPFNIVHLNIRSLLGHLDQVIEFAETTAPDIPALSETWLDASSG